MTQPPFPPNPGPPGTPGPTEPFTPVTPEPFYTPPAPPARRAGGGSRGLNLALAAAVLIAACGVSFAAGRVTAPTALASSTGQSGLARGGQNGLAGAPNGSSGPLASGGALPNASFNPNANGNAFGRGDDNGLGRGAFGSPTVQGTVTDVSSTSITVQLSSGATVTVGLNGSTTYHLQSTGSQSDVAAGKTVILQVNGRFGPDALQGGGTLGTATDVTVLP